ncbi:FAD-dependent pyridine nucleotide-disulfide oxidoreductase [Isosphaera pallida ATCC 43644]|uniref:FAD-dependent pyridine nucleotide-disulfide oxidoreductase n=1 Tax=Isosphaera pallida (strain ATCC 43644 / DSM 9630 / IS1B) TaxID=575540 RepID=E8QX72_ISOPI|nr:dihydrolipoyl dehydrogenase [Isosphaera pallida]ADV60905.1 FAD-dependent pyridine nucleotide-disulfide oxidoreductase [Isosphaera pallida ATCC 43644]
MNQESVTFAIIGAGTAGMRAYREIARHSDSIRLIEGGRYGTTCARVGCMPSKLLIAAAERAHQVRHADLFGVRVPEVQIDGRAVMKRVRSERDRFVGFVVETVHGFKEEHRIQAFARFLDNHTLKLSDGRILKAERVVIATGSRPTVPPLLQGLEDRVITSDDLFEWEDLPKSVAVLGSGVIGLELGQALHRLGVRVKIFGRNGRVGGLTDPAVVAEANRIFATETPIDTRARVERVERADNGLILHYFDGDNREHIETFELVLAATGRMPNVDRLGLENTSLTCDDRGVPHHDPLTGQCGDSPIFIAGDATHELPLLHEASDEGQVAGLNAVHYPEVHRYAKRAPITVIFTDPQLMIVGPGHRALSQRATPVVTGAVDFGDQGRSRILGENRGLLHVYGEPVTGRFLGAEMVGPRAEHLAHLLAWSLQSNLTVADMLERPFYHPVIEEGLRTALRNLHAKLGQEGSPGLRRLNGTVSRD